MISSPWAVLEELGVWGNISLPISFLLFFAGVFWPSALHSIVYDPQTIQVSEEKESNCVTLVIAVKSSTTMTLNVNWKLRNPKDHS